MRVTRALSLLLMLLALVSAGCQSSWFSGLYGASAATPSLPPLPLPTSTAAAAPTLQPTFTLGPEATVTSTPTPSITPSPPVTAVEIARGNTERPWIALTFDAGASSAPADSILDTLHEKGVHCTFFLTGDWVRQNPELVQRIVAEGHELGNHSNTHPQFTQLSDEEMGTELAGVEEAVLALTGRSTKPYFRPPFGNRDDRVLQAVRDNGYLTIYWTYFVWDWVEDTTPESVLNYAINGACNGAIVVLHLGSPQTAAALPEIIDALRAGGYRLVTLGEMLAP